MKKRLAAALALALLLCALLAPQTALAEGYMETISIKGSNIKSHRIGENTFEILLPAESVTASIQVKVTSAAKDKFLDYKTLENNKLTSTHPKHNLNVGNTVYSFDEQTLKIGKIYTFSIYESEQSITPIETATLICVAQSTGPKPIEAVSVTPLEGEAAKEGETDTGTSSTLYKVTASRLNVRSGPGLGNAIIGKVKRGTVVEVVSINGSWAQIQNGSATAYVSLTYLEKQ